MIGKDIRIERIMDRNTGRSVIVPMDHGFSMGQIEGLLDMTKVITDVSDGGANAIILHKGLVKRGHRKHGRDIGLFIHLSGSTSLNPDPNDKVQVCTVEEAIALGADAVSIHINLGSPNESKMLEIGANVARDCNRWGMPLLTMIYPRGKGIDSVLARSRSATRPGSGGAGRGPDQDQLPGRPGGLPEDREGLLGAGLHCRRREDRRPRVPQHHPGLGQGRRCRGLRGEERLPARGHESIRPGPLPRWCTTTWTRQRRWGKKR